MPENIFQENFINKIIYKLAFFFALLFKRLGLSPNFITCISFLFALLAFTFLITKNLIGYLFFWFLSYIFDYADGTLARITKKIGGSALRIDHISDLIKISVIFLAIALYFNNILIWILTFICSTIYLFYSVLSHEIYWTKKYNIKKINLKKKKVLNNSKIFLKFYKFFEEKKKFIKKIIPNFISIFVNINGHTLLILFFIPLNINLAYIFMIYFIFICTFQSVNLAMQLNVLKRA